MNYVMTLQVMIITHSMQTRSHELMERLSAFKERSSLTHLWVEVRVEDGIEADGSLGEQHRYDRVAVGNYP